MNIELDEAEARILRRTVEAHLRARGMRDTPPGDLDVLEHVCHKLGMRPIGASRYCTLGDIASGVRWHHGNEPACAVPENISVPQVGWRRPGETNA